MCCKLWPATEQSSAAKFCWQTEKVNICQQSVPTTLRRDVDTNVQRRIFLRLEGASVLDRGIARLDSSAVREQHQESNNATQEIKKESRRTLTNEASTVGALHLHPRPPAAGGWWRRSAVRGCHRAEAFARHRKRWHYEGVALLHHKGSEPRQRLDPLHAAACGGGSSRHVPLVARVAASVHGCVLFFRQRQ